ncbi:MAG TPA: hypothetical protein VG186_17925 [Solirubrobacteraceae bacterium]|nr:hypothetical protein [Solirubrobacteraceae bacterium]
MLTFAFMASTAGASSDQLAHGQAGPYPWQLTASSTVIGKQRIPGVCVAFLWAWGVGQPIGNGAPACVAPASGHYTGGGHIRWSFNLHAGHMHGVEPSGSGSPGSIRGLVFLVDPRATKAVATMSDGEVLSLRTVALPRRLHRAARIAWSVTTGGSSSPSALHFSRVLAYDRHGRVVGRYP